MKPRSRVRRFAIIALGIFAAVIAAICLHPLVLEEYYMRRMDSDDFGVKRGAAEKLAAMRSRRAIPKLLRELQAPGGGTEVIEVRLGKSERRAISASWAARVLARIGPDAIPELRELLKDPRNFVRWNASAALMEIGPGAREAAEDLAELLQDHPHAQAAAAKALARIGEPAIPVLLEQLRQENGENYLAAISLGEIGTPAISDLRRMLVDPAGRVRSWAAFACWQMGPEGSEALPDLMAALRDPEGYVRSRAARALGAFPEEGSRIVPLLMAAREDEKPWVRAEVFKSMGSFRSEMMVVLPALLEALEDQEAEIREAAATGIGDLGPAAASAVPAVIALLDDPDSAVRMRALETIGDLGPSTRGAELQIRDLLRDADQGVRNVAEKALERITAAE